MGVYITPCIVSDHQLITVNVIVSETKPCITGVLM